MQKYGTISAKSLCVEHKDFFLNELGIINQKQLQRIIDER